MGVPMPVEKTRSRSCHFEPFRRQTLAQFREKARKIEEMAAKKEAAG